MDILPKSQLYHTNLMYLKRRHGILSAKYYPVDTFESIHDDYTGEMKLCEMGKIYSILDLEQKRKKEKYRNNKSKGKPKQKKEKSQVKINHTKCMQMMKIYQHNVIL